MKDLELAEGYIKAVSYTHLDVYKRQIKGRDKDFISLPRLFHAKGSAVAGRIASGRPILPGLFRQRLIFP